MENFDKQSSEKFVISIDYDDNLNTGEAITTYTVKSYLASSEVNGIIDGYELDDTSKIVYVTVKGGSDGLNYKITVVVNTTEGNIYEKDVLMRVIDI